MHVAAVLQPQERTAAERAVLSYAATRQDDESDRIDLVDVLDPDLFPIFEEEASELLPKLGGALRQWATLPDNMIARGEVLRALHTLKGSSRLAGALQLGEMAHRMESQIEGLGKESVQAEDILPLLGRLDVLEAKFETLQHVNLHGPILEAPVVAAPVVETIKQIAIPEATASMEPVKVESLKAVIALPAPMMVSPVRAAANQVVRVRAQLLDRLVNQAGEVMITRSRLEAEMGQLRGSLQDLAGNLDRLRQQLRDIELQAESQMQSRMAQTKDSQQNFDPLEFDRFTRVQELTRMMAESVNDVATVQRNLQRTVESTEDDLIAQARQTRALQQDLLRTRMMEFEGISERLYRVVRQAAKDTGKQVKLDINGGSIEMDRGVLDRMTAAFEHLLRNCVVHGIEDPVVRTAAGKEPVGTITIDLQQASNDVSVTFRDDGAGLDVHRILGKAIQHGLVTAGQVMSDDEAASLIFMPGFTTATEVTELAGRGIGMDVVRSEVQALGGRIETSTRSGQGASFKLVLPLTTAVTQVVVMRSGALSVGVPANLVELVRRIPASELQQAYSTGVLEFAGEPIPFFWSGALLQSSPHSIEPTSRTMPVVIFRSAAQRVAVHMDEILGNQEAVVKNLGPQLSRLPGLAGMTVLASGAVVLIYNPVALATVYGEQARQFSAAQAQVEAAAALALAQGVETAAPKPAISRVPLIMVVDDSITVRRVTQRLLQREGYRVVLAADGLQALEKLQDEQPVVVLSDIEMPRMDGFDLARNIRADERLKGLPIIMITSRIAEKHREHAQTLGVNHYLGKPYSEEELLSLVRHYVEIPALV
jgi:chemosensory pili system protein ChpA (sensor histidine kinase/response regulator)